MTALAHGHRPHERAEVAELAPGAGIHDDDGVDVAEFVARGPEPLDRRRERVRELVPRAQVARHGHADRLAELSQGAGQPDLRPEGVAVGADVGHDQEPLVRPHELDERRPVDGHSGWDLSGREYSRLYFAGPHRTHSRRPFRGDCHDETDSRR